MEKINFISQPEYEDYVNTDKETRVFANNLIK